MWNKETNRPDSWMNPYLQQNEQGDYVNSRVYEAGADAIIEPAKAEGRRELFTIHEIKRLSTALRRHYEDEWCTVCEQLEHKLQQLLKEHK